MIYIDYCFRSRTTGTLIAMGWAHGPVGGGLRLASKKFQMQAGFISRHRRSDLAADCTGFLVRFDLPSHHNHLDAVIELADSNMSVKIPPAIGGFSEMAQGCLDEVFIDLLIAVGLDEIRLETPEQIGLVHARALRMANPAGMAETKSAMLALDVANVFDEPCRILTTGWMATDLINPANSSARQVAMILDEDCIHPVHIHWQQLLRADLSDLHIPNMQVGTSSGYIGAVRPNAPVSAQALCVVCLSYKNQPITRIRSVTRYNHEALGHQLQRLDQIVIGQDTLGRLLGILSPDVPAFERKTPPEPASGPLAIALDHNMDHGLIRDVLRHLRRVCPEKSEVVVTNRHVSDYMIKSAQSDQVEAGEKSLNVRWVSGKARITDWAPKARYLIFGSSEALFQVNVFPLFGEMREQAVPVTAVFLTDFGEADFTEISPADAAQQCLDGAQFVAQLDLKAFALGAGGAAAFASEIGQVRWLLYEFAKAGAGEFREYSSTSMSEVAETTSEAIRFLENLAFRRGALESLS